MANDKPNFAVGEIWNTLAYGSDGKPVYNEDIWSSCEMDTSCCVAAFDFTTKGILQKLQFQE